MTIARRLTSLLRNLLRRDRVDRDLDRELDGILDTLTDEGIDRGLPPEEARRAAHLALGGPEQVKEEVRAARSGALLDAFLRDLRFGARLLRRSPGFTAVVVLTLALGIGAATSIFSVVRAVLLSPLPYREPERLVLLRQAWPQRGLNFWRLSQANFSAYRDGTKSFDSVGAYTWTGYNVGAAGESFRVEAAAVSADLFATLGVEAALGRTFVRGEDAPGRRLLCLLSDGEWRRRFGGDPGVVGTTLRLDGVPAEVIGVMPRGFAFPDSSAGLWTPLEIAPERTSPFTLLAVARLQPGTALAAAEEETTGILRARAAARAAFGGANAPPAAGADLHTVVRPLGDAMTAGTRTPLLLLFAAVGLVLLIVCANVANLVLARSGGRAREIAVRFALGATRGRIARQVLTELLLLGALGGAAGSLLALPILGLARRLPAGFVPRLEEVRLDPVVFGAALLAGAMAAVLAGLLPALRAGRDGASLHAGPAARSTAAPRGRRLNGGLVGVQFALSLLLLAGTGLMLKSLDRLLSVDPGFETDHLLTLHLDLPPRQAGVYANPLAPVAEAEAEGTERYYSRVVEAVRAQPGVQSAALAQSLPFGGDLDADMTVCEGHDTGDGASGSLTLIQRTTPGYFSTLRLPLLRGRDFEARDRTGAPAVVIVDETLARNAWPGQDAIGRRIRFAWDDGPDRWRTIVGVVAAVRDDRLDRAAEPHLYVPFRQEPMRRMSLVARTGIEPDRAAPAIQEALRSVDPSVPPFALRSMESTLRLSLFQRRLTNGLLGAFAAIALLLAAAGIYGVMSLEVSSRFKEIAVRLALGARPAGVVGMVLRRGAGLAAAGMAAGLAGSFALMRFLSGLLFEVRPDDPGTLFAVVALLGSVALLACALPARRAVRVDPIAALRDE
jgi:putative ABC transport system permease protein